MPPIAGLLFVLCGFPTAHGQATDSASVGVSIRILPIASIEFPDGFDFIIIVPEDGGHDKSRGKGHDSHGNGNGYGHGEDSQWPVIEPVLIPFKVRGNALASITARPDEFMRIHQGPYLGAAIGVGGDSHKNQQGKGHHKGKGHDKGGDGELGYNVVVKFPLHSWSYAHLDGGDGLGQFSDGYASLSGENGVGTPALTADVSQRSHGAYGMIVIVAKSDWTRDGQDAAPGEYRGAVEVTITADE